MWVAPYGVTNSVGSQWMSVPFHLFLDESSGLSCWCPSPFCWTWVSSCHVLTNWYYFNACPQAIFESYVNHVTQFESLPIFHLGFPAIPSNFQRLVEKGLHFISNTTFTGLGWSGSYVKDWQININKLNTISWNVYGVKIMKIAVYLLNSWRLECGQDSEQAKWLHFQCELRFLGLRVLNIPF